MKMHGRVLVKRTFKSTRKGQAILSMEKLSIPTWKYSFREFRIKTTELVKKRGSGCGWYGGGTKSEQSTIAEELDKIS